MPDAPQWGDVLGQILTPELKLVSAFCSENADQAAEVYNLQKITLLREISLKTGVQVRSTSSLSSPSCSIPRKMKSKRRLLCKGRPFSQTMRALEGLCGVNVGIEVPALGKEISNPVPF